MQLETFSKCKPFRARADTIRRLTLYPLASPLPRYPLPVPSARRFALTHPHWTTRERDGATSAGAQTYTLHTDGRVCVSAYR